MGKSTYTKQRNYLRKFLVRVSAVTLFIIALFASCRNKNQRIDSKNNKTYRHFNNLSSSSVQNYTKGNPAKFLFLIDMQNDFVTGSLGTKEAVKIVSNIEKLISDYKRLEFKIIFTQDTHDSAYNKT